MHYWLSCKLVQKMLILFDPVIPLPSDYLQKNSQEDKNLMNESNFGSIVYNIKNSGIYSKDH